MDRAEEKPCLQGQTPHSSMLPPKLDALGAQAAPRTSLSSCLTYGGTAAPFAGPGLGPISQLHHPLGVSLSSSPGFVLPLPFDFERDRVRRDDLSLLPLLPASGGSMKETRFGVVRPDPVMPIASDTLSQLLLSERVGDVGVGGADLPLRPFSADCRGGLGGRVEDVWRAFVNSLETCAVAVEASATGLTGGGLRNDGRATSFCFPLSCAGGDTGLFSRIFRRQDTVRSTCRSSDEDELDAEGSSMIGGVSHVRRIDDGERFAESRLAEREDCPA